MLSRKISVGYLTHGEIIHEASEEFLALSWLKSVPDVDVSPISFSEIADSSVKLSGFSVLWWHHSQSKNLPDDALSEKVKSSLLNYLENNGSLFLSLFAFQYIYHLGMEKNPPDEIFKGVWREKGDGFKFNMKKGFHSHHGHPILDKPFFGGVYTWSPTPGDTYVKVGYTHDNWPANGKVVGVKWSYITIDPDSKPLVEYFIKDRAAVLSAGAYIYFKAGDNIFDEHLKRFLISCFKYLSGCEFSKIKPSWWRKAEPPPESLLPVDEADVSGFLPPVKGFPGVKFRGSGLEMQSDTEDDSYFDLSGRRMLIVGKESGKICDAWCYPIRLFKDLQFWIEANGETAVSLHSQAEKCVIRPESVRIVYDELLLNVEELVYVNHESAYGWISLKCNGGHSFKLILVLSFDFRYIWPMPEGYFDYFSGVKRDKGTLEFLDSDGLYAVNFHFMEGSDFLYRIEPPGDQNGSINLEVGSRDKFEQLGSNRIFVESGNRLVLRVEYRMSAESPEFLFYFTCISRNFESNPSVSRDLIRGYRSTVKYYRNLLEKFLTVETPDACFNEGYKWAVVGVDKFYTCTPGIGKGLMAGYAGTGKGWLSGRPGYSWFFGRDSVWTALAMLAYGDFEKVRDTLTLLGDFQEFNGKIFHELSPAGVVHHDSADSTPLYLILAGKYLEYTGDLDFISSQRERILKAIEFCYSTDLDKDGLIENTKVGHGWVEGGKLWGAHVSLYLASLWAEALSSSFNLLNNLGYKELAERVSRDFGIVKRKISRAFWDPHKKYFYFGMLKGGKFIV
ncbi:MAG: DUF4960 domain-containing protein [Fidelibacterota bacterium]